MRGEHFSQLEADDPSLSDRHEQKGESLTHQAKKSSSKKYFLIAIFLTIIFALFVLLEVNSLREESNESLTELKTLKA
jgi:hypothetical protein